MDSVLGFWVQVKTVETLTSSCAVKDRCFFVSACWVLCFRLSDVTSSHITETEGAKNRAVPDPRVTQ